MCNRLRLRGIGSKSGCLLHRLHRNDSLSITIRPAYHVALPGTRVQSPVGMLSYHWRCVFCSPISQSNLPISPRPPTSVSPHSAHRLISSSNLSLLCVSACVLRFACRIFTPFGSVCRYAHSITDTPAPRTATFFLSTLVSSSYFVGTSHTHTHTHTHRGTYTDTDCSPAIRARTRWQTATKKRAARK